jgi:hypothetical protein
VPRHVRGREHHRGFDPTAPSFVTAFPSGESLPNASNLNLAPGHIVSNAAIVKIGSTGGISLRNLAGSAHLIVDVTGAFGPTAGVSSR